MLSWFDIRVAQQRGEQVGSGNRKFYCNAAGAAVPEPM
jgi:hypothetical protein